MIERREVLDYRGVTPAAIHLRLDSARDAGKCIEHLENACRAGIDCVPGYHFDR